MNKIKVSYFGMLAEVAGKDFEMVDVAVGWDVEKLLNHLHQKYPELKSRSYKLALNNSIITGDAKMNLTGHLALLPPFSGG